MNELTRTTENIIQQNSNKRARYSAGMLLNATDLTADQTYFLGKHANHNRHLHGYGTVNGLEVRYEREENGKQLIKVNPGLGIDRLGRSFTVDQVYCADLDSFLQNPPTGYKDGEPIYVVAYYAEKTEDPRPIASVTQACTDTTDGKSDSRTVDSFCLKLLAARPPMPLWEASRIFYNGLEAGTDLDEVYRQWVREDLPILREREADTLDQTDGAAILLAKVVLTSNGNEGEEGDYPYAEEDQRPYLLHTQLLQGLSNMTGQPTSATHPLQLATIELKDENTVTVWFPKFHTGQPLVPTRNSLLVTRAFLDKNADGSLDESTDALPVEAKLEPFSFAWKVTLGNRLTFAQRDLLMFEFDPAQILYGTGDKTRTLAQLMEEEGIYFLGYGSYDGGKTQKIRQYLIVDVTTRRIHDAVRTLRTLPFVTITPGPIAREGQVIEQTFELWFHVDFFVDPKQGKAGAARMPKLRIWAEMPNISGFTPRELTPSAPMEQDPSYPRVYRLRLQGTLNDNLASITRLRFDFQLDDVKVQLPTARVPMTLQDFMAGLNWNFEGYGPDFNGEGKAVIVYVRNTFGAGYAPPSFSEVSLPDFSLMAGPTPPPAAVPARRKRSTTKK